MDNDRRLELETKILPWLQGQKAPDWSHQKNQFEHLLANQSDYYKNITVVSLNMPGGISQDRLTPALTEAWSKFAGILQNHLAGEYLPLGVTPTEISYQRPMPERIRKLLSDQLNSLIHDDKIDEDSGEILDEDLAAELA